MTAPRSLDGGLGLAVFTSNEQKFGDGQTFSPTTSSLITGDKTAVLVDAGYIKSEVAALGDFIAASGKQLTTIYVTHPHADHYFGIGELLERFPRARAVALPEVVEAIHAAHERSTKIWESWFGAAVSSPTVLPQPLDAEAIDLEGQQLRLINIGQGDVAPSTVVHVPALDAAIAGDVVYNQIHPFLATTGPKQWGEWVDSIDRIERLAPRVVVAGHKKPDASDEDLNSLISGTRSYIRDFTETVGAGATTAEIVARMTEKYPHYGNLTTLHMAAAAAGRQPDGAATTRGR
jgi:glyoxylase-like metal-dependent hydrolase (beta-lactamase superfamily II)